MQSGLHFITELRADIQSQGVLKCLINNVSLGESEWILFVPLKMISNMGTQEDPLDEMDVSIQYVSTFRGKCGHCTCCRRFLNKDSGRRPCAHSSIPIPAAFPTDLNERQQSSVGIYTRASNFHPPFFCMEFLSESETLKKRNC